MATETSYGLSGHSYVHFSPVNILRTAFCISAFCMLIEEQLFRSAMVIQYICQDVTQFRPVMKFGPCPLKWPNFCGLLVTVLTGFHCTKFILVDVLKLLY